MIWQGRIVIHHKRNFSLSLIEEMNKLLTKVSRLYLKRELKVNHSPMVNKKLNKIFRDSKIYNKSFTFILRHLAGKKD